MERFFPPSRMLQLKDEIYNFRQLKTEALHKRWLRFKKKLTKFLNHKIPDDSLLEFFYKSLNNNTKVVADTVVGRALMSHSWEEEATTLDRVTKTNRACNTKEAEAVTRSWLI